MYVLNAVGPAKQLEKFGQDHRRGTPNLLAADVKCRHVDLLTVSIPFVRSQAVAVQKIGDGYFENTSDLPLCGGPHRACCERRDDGAETEATYGDLHGRERSDDAHTVGRQRDLFARLTQRRLLERLSRLDDAPWQRYLSTVPAQSPVANRQDDVRTFIDGEDDQEYRGLSDAGPVETVGPLASRRWREASVRSRPWQRLGEGGLQSFDGRLKCQGHRAELRTPVERRVTGRPSWRCSWPGALGNWRSLPRGPLRQR